jgi:hypothetical protein
MINLIQIEWPLALSHVTHLLMAYVLALPIGWDREHSNRRFGLRTFSLVAVVTCGFMLVGMSVISSTDGEARIIQGIITGIGFIGGGAIFIDQDKVAGTAEGSARQVLRLAKERFRPEIIWRNLRNTFSNLWSAQRELPRLTQQIISKLEKGELGFKLQLNRLEQLVNSLESASNRLTTAIITGAIIMGSSMIITTGIGPYLFGFPALGVIGYLLSVVLGLWLIVTIIGARKY